MMRFPAVAAALAIGLAANAAGPIARAAPAQVTVRLSDLDLASAAGARSALTRLTRAAAEACGEQANVNPDLIRQSEAFGRCRAEAIATAVARVPGPAILAAYAKTRGRILQLAGR